ncbi:hypothetical protein [Paenibacillus illinoisensis]|uniref:hypothetical protein n=1 Tax=Paenibacillus illinoisensis TaxID=59845 RepID=UPI00301C2536
MKISHLLEVEIVVDMDHKEKLSTIYDGDLDYNDYKQVEEIALYKINKALEHLDLTDRVTLIDQELPTLQETQKLSFSRNIVVAGAKLRSSYITVTFKPVLKANGWIFNLDPVKINSIYFDSNFK